MDHSPQVRSQVGFYGSSDNTGSHTEVGLRFINANSKSKSDDLGPIGECCLSLVGTIGTQDGRNSAFVHFRLLEPNTIRLVRLSPSEWPADDEESWLMLQTARKIEYPQWFRSYRESGNFYTAKYIHCGLSDQRGKQIGLDNQGFALGNSEPRDILPRGEYYATITTQQASTPIPFHVQLVVGNPLVQTETTQITKKKCIPAPTPSPTPTPTPTPSATPTPSPTPTPSATPAPSPSPTPTPTPTPSATPTPSPTPTPTPSATPAPSPTPTPTPSSTPERRPLFSRILPPNISAFHRPLVLEAMTIVERYVEPHADMKTRAQLVEWRDGTGYVAAALPVDITLLEDSNGNPLAANTNWFRFYVNEDWNDYFSEDDWIAIWCHECFHALGIVFWRFKEVTDFFGHSLQQQSKGYLNATEHPNTVDGYQKHTGKSDSTIAPLYEARSAHWNDGEKTFDDIQGTYPGHNDVMTPYANAGRLITNITLGALEDYGYKITKVADDGVSPKQLRSLRKWECGADAIDHSGVTFKIRRV